MITLDVQVVPGRIYIGGDTFSAKERIKSIGGHWDPDRKAWWVGKAKFAEAEKLAASDQKPAPAAVPGKCRDCGGQCKEPYTLCFACKGKRDQRAGVCGKCRGRLNDWERRHGVRLCADCRDGGGNARGGQSYHDRHGNFVLGDDD